MTIIALNRGTNTNIKISYSYSYNYTLNLSHLIIELQNHSESINKTGFNLHLLTYGTSLTINLIVL